MRVSREVSNAGINRVCVDRAVREPGGGMSAHHCHSYYELYYVEQGACSLMIDNRIYDLSAGDYVLIPPQTFHYSRYLNKPCVRCNIYFRAEDIGKYSLSFLSQNPDFFSRARFFHINQQNRTQINELHSRMIAEEETSDERTPALQYLHLQELFILLSRICSFTQDLPEDTQATDQQLLLAARFISENYMNAITSADIAAAAGFSPNYLSRKFRETAGIGVHEYLVFTRLQHAAMELLASDDTITQIALRCGFSDSNYFKDAFKKKYGVTPREYRNSMKK